MKYGFWEIILIVVLIVILFGSAKIPGMMKNLANGVKVFKKEIKEKPEQKPAEKKKPAPKKKVIAKKAKQVFVMISRYRLYFYSVSCYKNAGFVVWCNVSGEIRVDL